MASSVLAFIIGLAIILLASILNAAGLNLTKLDHACPFIYLLLFLISSPGQIFRSTKVRQKKGLHASSMAPRNASLHACISSSSLTPCFLPSAAFHSS